MSQHETHNFSRLSTECRKIQALGRRARYPQEIRDEILGLLSAGVSMRSLSDEVGLSQSILKRWSRKASSHREDLRILDVRKETTPPSERSCLFSIQTEGIEVQVFSMVKP